MTVQSTRVPTRAIILSAGQGRRLLPLTENRPKCLLPVAGKTLIEWQIDALLAAGIKEVVVVTGFRTDLVEALLCERYSVAGHVSVCFNPFYDVSDNLASCWIARAAMSSDFLLLNGDTLFEPALLDRVLSSENAPITLTVDHKDVYDDDDMKVQLDGAGVRHVSKTLAPNQIDAESIGLLYFRDQGAERFRRTVEETLRTPAGLRSWYLAVVDRLAGEHIVRACSITGLRWCEIDFIEDLERAETLFAAAAGDDTAGGMARQASVP